MMKKKPMEKNDVHFAFFGTSHIAVFVLNALKDAGFIPGLIITPPDKPQGRGLLPEPVEAAKWAREHGVLLAHNTAQEFKKEKWDVCIIVDYGKILPREVLDIPRRGFLNVHPSLLPRLRGPSPIKSAILNDEKTTGVSIMLVDEKTDHGPLIAQKRITIPNWPPHLAELEEILMKEGGKLLAQILPQWTAGEIDAHEQNHDVATYTEKFNKEAGLLDLEGDARANLLKIRSYEGWPGTYAFFERESKKIRVNIIDAHLEGGKLMIDRVKPEGKREMDYVEFLRSGAKPISRSQTS